MDKLKLASLGERLKNQGAQMGRMMSTKMKDLLQTPTPESKMVDEATSEALREPNWGMNMRICAMINGEEFSGAEVLRALKKKMSGKNAAVQRLSLELLEACAMNCEKVFSEVASEKVLEEMVKMIDNPQADSGNRRRAWELIRAWGESEDLAYLPVFRQTYMMLKERGSPVPVEDGNSPVMQHSLESFVHQQPMSSHIPIPGRDSHGEDHLNFPYNYAIPSVEEKKEFLVITRNSLELLSSMLNSGTEEEKLMKDDLTVSMLEKCKQSLPVIQRIIESMGDDEGLLFEALNLHDELQQVISRCEELQTSAKVEEKTCETSSSPFANSPVQVGAPSEARVAELPKGRSTESSSDDRNVI
ncbi:TOM1-like protein 2 [Malania oleifera]|uniref:TOM1-like protein 2 n=1 Tax=Malania oleifera TaxID=397392 RepID=UPI0025ADFFB4|nr:TOM1-like protein 2 [Malania oleifera]